MTVVEDVLQQHRALLNEIYVFSHKTGASMQDQIKRHAWQTLLVKHVLKQYGWPQIKVMPPEKEMIARLREQAMQWYTLGR
ncbi:hypothetical protein [Vibrio stylophorae]|nr:hypothetical protein [Vibrio stylophorae]